VGRRGAVRRVRRVPGQPRSLALHRSDAGGEAADRGGVTFQNTSFRSSPRGAPRDSKSAFTRVCDALGVAGTPDPGFDPWIPACAGMSGVLLRSVADPA